MDQDKVNPFSVNPGVSAGNPSMSPSSPATQPTSAQVPVNPYAPAGAPYAPGSNTPPPDFATPIYSGNNTLASSGASSPAGDAPAVPNTAPRFSSPGPAYTAISPAPSQLPSGQSIPPTPEKSKLFPKKFVIFASIGLVLIVAAVVTGVVLSNSRNTQKNNSSISAKSSNIKQESKEVQNLFNQYANWIINGTSSDDAAITTAEPDPKTTYYIKKVFLGKEGDPIAYMAKAKEYSGNLANSINDSSSLKDLVSSSNNDIMFLAEYLNNGIISTEEIVQLYNDLGANNTTQEIARRYQVYTEMPSYSANGFAEAVEEYASLMIEYLEKLKTAGCLAGGSIDKTCESLILSNSEELNTKNIEISDKKIEAENLAMGTINTVINNCWAIANGANIAGREK